MEEAHLTTVKCHTPGACSPALPLGHGSGFAELLPAVPRMASASCWLISMNLTRQPVHAGLILEKEPI